MSELDDLLRTKEPIADAGFTQRVMAGVPRRHRWLRVVEALLPPMAVAALVPSLPLTATLALSFGIAVLAFQEA